MHKISKNPGSTKYSRPQTGDMMPVPHWGFTSIRHHRAKFSRLGVLALGFVYPCIYIHTDIIPRQMSNILTSYKSPKIYNRVHVAVNLDCEEVLKSRQIAVLYICIVWWRLLQINYFMVCVEPTFNSEHLLLGIKIPQLIALRNK